LLGLAGLSAAHFTVDYPTWRGDSFADGASQWSFPCANVTELPADHPNRTAWPMGGSIRMDVTHEWAFTYVNLGLGTNVTSFNISLIEGFNQTGNGTFCVKEAGKANLAAALEKMGRTMESLEGQPASLQIIQLSTRGSSLYNCADITFNSSAQILGDDQCSNSTGVGGVALQNAGEQGGNQTESGEEQPQPTGAAARVGGSVAFAAVLGA
ncbi:hypothetical protein M011DRAFT_374038, partial [Sporormia fimetaria CBS 119925]